MSKDYYFCYLCEEVFWFESYMLMKITTSSQLMKKWKSKNRNKKYVIKYGKSKEQSYILCSYEYRTLKS